MSEALTEIASLKEQVRSAFVRIEKLEENVKMIPRIDTLLEVTIEANKKHADTLVNINNNLTILNNNHENLAHRIVTIEDESKSNRSNSSVNINKLFTETIFKVVPSILGGLILAWLIIQFGLKK